VARCSVVNRIVNIRVLEKAKNIWPAERLKFSSGNTPCRFSYFAENFVIAARACNCEQTNI
jgi:hypothetical protein